MRRLKEDWEFAEVEWSSSAVKSLFKKKNKYIITIMYLFFIIFFLWIYIHKRVYYNIIHQGETGVF